ncbi:MAG TPA: TolC family protein [Balneolales bacterium]|nr:TolC family protein [Balneolales bacterium]
MNRLYRLFVLAWGMTVFTALPGLLMGQDTAQVRRMSLEQALKLAQKQNFDIRKTEADVREARSDYRSTNALFLPQVNVEETAVSTNDPLNVFGFKLKQEIVSATDFNPVLLNNPDRTHNYQTKISVQQPILNVDGFLGRSAARDKLSAVRQQLNRQSYYVEFQVKQAYFGLTMANKQLAVIDTALHVAQAFRSQAEHFYKQGLINKADLLAARVRVLDLESQYAGAENNISKADDNLRYLLGLDEGTRLQPTDSLTMVAPPKTQVDYNWLNHNRSDMKAMRDMMSASHKMMQSGWGRYLPSLNAFGSYEWNDKTFLGTGANNYMIGAVLKWNLFGGFKNAANIEKSQAQYTKVKLMYEDKVYQNRLQVDQVQRNMKQARRQVKLGNAAVEQAAENLRIRTNRYAKGLERTTDVLQAEAALSEARLKRLHALYQYRMSVSMMELLLEQNLVK